MTTPPPEPPGQGWPPPGYPYYPPYPPPPRQQSSAGLVIGLAVAGAVAYFAVNFVAVILVLALAADQPDSGYVIIAGTVGLALFAFGIGGLLVALRKPWALGLGLGLMIGWALTSILTVGICTGINPSIYGSL